jgi:predicted O-methyltransferase YrrM
MKQLMADIYFRHVLLRAWITLRRHVWYMSWPCDKPFASHVPVLIALANIVRPKSVLELGSGLYSTGTFLNRSLFPELEHLDTWEDDPTWIRTIKQTLGGDSRLELHTAQAPIHKSITGVVLSQYDVIFIDDSKQDEDRAQTISTVVANRTSRNVIVIHDFEKPCYRSASAGPAHSAAMTALLPNTGVLWDRPDARLRTILDVDQTIRRYRREAPEDVVFWRSVFHEHGEIR